MITTRTRLLQVMTPNGWQWIFCYSQNEGRIVSTINPRKGLRYTPESQVYFENRGGVCRSISQKDFAGELTLTVLA